MSALSLMALTQGLVSCIVGASFRVTGLDDDSVAVAVRGGFTDARRLQLLPSTRLGDLRLQFHDDDGLHDAAMPESTLHGFLVSLNATRSVRTSLKANAGQIRGSLALA